MMTLLFVNWWRQVCGCCWCQQSDKSLTAGGSSADKTLSHLLCQLMKLLTCQRGALLIRRPRCSLRYLTYVDILWNGYNMPWTRDKNKIAVLKRWHLSAPDLHTFFYPTRLLQIRGSAGPPWWHLHHSSHYPACSSCVVSPECLEKACNERDDQITHTGCTRGAKYEQRLIQPRYHLWLISCKVSLLKAVPSWKTLLSACRAHNSLRCFSW